MGRYVNKRYKTRRRDRDADQIFNDDMASDKSIVDLSEQPLQEDRPGLGQFYCIPCARYFESEVAKRTHARGKIHRRRLKEIKEGVYTPEEANYAAGSDVIKFLNQRHAREEKQTVPIIKDLLTVPKGEQKKVEKKQAGVKEVEMEEVQQEPEEVVEDAEEQLLG